MLQQQVKEQIQPLTCFKHCANNKEPLIITNQTNAKKDNIQHHRMQGGGKQCQRQNILLFSLWYVLNPSSQCPPPTPGNLWFISQSIHLLRTKLLSYYKPEIAANSVQMRDANSTVSAIHDGHNLRNVETTS